MNVSVEKGLIGNAFIMLSTIFWGVNYAFTKALIPDWMTASDVSAVRLAGGAILFWLASFFLKTEKLDKDSLVRSVFAGAIGLFGCIYLFVLSLKYGNAIDISIIMTMPPIFVILMEVCFRHRRPSWLEYLGIILSFIGATLIILANSGHSQSASNPSLGCILGVIASLCFAFYLCILAKPSIKYNPFRFCAECFFLRQFRLFYLCQDCFICPCCIRRVQFPSLRSSLSYFAPHFSRIFSRNPP